MTLKISTRLWLPTLVQLTVVAALATVMAVRTQGQIELSNGQLALQQSKLEDAHTWQGLTSANIARTLAAVLSADPQVEAATKPEIAATSARISELQKRIDAQATEPDEKASLATVADKRKAYIALRDEIRQQKAGGDAAGAAAALESRLRPVFEAYVSAQQAFVKLQKERSNELREAMGRGRMQTVWGVSAVMLLLVAGLAVGSVLLVRSVSRPIAELAGVARRVGEGDLTVDIPTDRGDEIGEVMRSLAGMRDALSRTVGQVRQAADSIQVASAEVASGNTDLSQRTEQTASDLQQTASSIEQLTASVRQSADAASQANQLSASASAVAQRGGQVVSQVVSTMDEINQSSRRIADIIGTIDGIAFQTNILALNAAVEAARAGEQGRGFAVVAGEVRSLAQRSAEAAREIKTLIGTSVDKVETGARLVQDAGSTMTEIVASVQRVTDIIGEISAAAAEQSAGIGQVNGAITGLDQMTQQNAALVEQSAAAAESLREQALRLGQTMQVFRLSDGGPAALPGLAPVRSAAAIQPAPPRDQPPLAAARPAKAAPIRPAAAAAQAAPPAPPQAPLAPPNTIERAVATARAAAPVSSDEWETF